LQLACRKAPSGALFPLVEGYIEGYLATAHIVWTDSPYDDFARAKLKTIVLSRFAVS
jgi:hypothetical protein